MRVVVTGSSGRIGQQVVKELAAHDYEVDRDGHCPRARAISRRASSTCRRT